MLSENEARALLREAGDTVPVTAGTDLLETARRARRGRRAVIASAAAAVTIIVAGGTAVGLTGPETSGPIAPAGPTTTAPITDGATEPTDGPSEFQEESGGPKLVDVPILVEYSEKEALRRVREWGLEAEVSREPAPCEPEGEVIQQVPQAGTKVPPGSTVVLVVGAGGSAGMPSSKVCTEGIASYHDRQIADLFVRFAQAPQAENAPFAPRVSIGLGGDIRGELTELETHDKDAWLIDGTYAAHSGPFSALAQVAEHPQGHVLSNDPSFGAREVCAPSPTGPPAELAELRLISIQPADDLQRSCATWWSVDLLVNEVGQIEGVFLTLAEP